MQRIVHNDLALEGKNQDQCQQQADNSYIVKLFQKSVFKIVQTLVFHHNRPGQHTAHQRDYHKQYHRKDQGIPGYSDIGYAQQKLHNGYKGHQDDEVIGCHLHHCVGRITFGQRTPHKHHGRTRSCPQQHCTGQILRGQIRCDEALE